MEGAKTWRCRRLKICCAVTALLSIVLLGVLLALYLTILRPREPEAIAYHVKLTKIEFNMFPQLKLNITLALLVSINNGNYGSFDYRSSTAYINYRGAIVAEAPIAAGKILVRGNTSVEIMADKLVLNPLFWVDLGVGSFNFTSLTTLQGKVKVFKIQKSNAISRSMCDISVFIHSQTANSTCNSKFKL